MIRDWFLILLTNFGPGKIGSMVISESIRYVIYIVGRTQNCLIREAIFTTKKETGYNGILLFLQAL